MGATNIEWTDFTFNPWWGCTKVSPGCTHCYADTFAKRVGHGKRLPTIWGDKAERRFFGDAHWQEPLKWAAKAAAAGGRARVFCASMADVFEDRSEFEEPRSRLAALIRMTPGLDWLILTKRPENMVRIAAPFWPGSWPSNVWAGCTVEDQQRADERIPWLLEVPARVRFLSCEPLLGPVDLENVHPYYLKRENPHPHDPIIRIDALRGHVKGPDEMLDAKVAWVIVGSESGPGARPMQSEWARDLVGQCGRAQVPCFVKQVASAADRKGGDWSLWPSDLRVRQFPEVPR